MKRSYILFPFCALLLVAGNLRSQVNAGPDQNICPPNCANLSATFTAVNETSSYNVGAIPYAPPQPYNVGTILPVPIDDEYSGVIPIGFTFCFYGTPHTDLLISTNDYLCFDLTQANLYSPWPIGAAIPDINYVFNDTPVDAIMGPWVDIDPSVGGIIRYGTYGTAPFRTFVVSFENVPYFLCNNLFITNQFVLYETTNIIELYIQSSQICAFWNGGAAIEGLHNFNGTLATPVPGRNYPTQWMVNNDAQRFTPSGPPAYSFAWYEGLNLVSTNPTVTVCPTTTTTYTAQITYTCGNLTYTDPMTVNVGVANANAGPDVTICTSQSTVLNATGGVTYVWTPATGLSCTTCANPTANPTSTTTYTVTVTDASGCTGTDVITVTVSPPPVPTISPNTAICLGDSANLTASGGATYSWVPASSLNNSAISNPIATPTTTTTYTVTVSNGSCSATATVTVTVNPLPNITAVASPLTICTSGSSQLTANNGVTYVWSPASSLSSSTGSPVTATPTTTTTYTVIGTDVNGCTNTATVTVTVTSLSATATAVNSQICPGGNTQLNSTGGGTYSWSPSTSLSNSTISNPIASPTTTTTYTVTVTDVNGCTGTATVTITVVPPPNLTATATPPSFCSGGNSQLNASGGVSYLWAPATNLSSTTIANPVASPTSTTTYTVTITDANGCSGTVTVTVTVNSATATATATPSSFCLGGNSALNAGGNGTSWIWAPAATLNSSTVQNPTATPLATVTYTVTVTDANGCTATATVTVTVNPLPTVTATATPTSFCQGGNSTITASGATSYAWTPSTGLSATSGASVTANPTSTTTYTVTGTNANGCTDTVTVTVTVNPGFTLSVATSSPETCGDVDGTATAGTPSGGTSPFTYLWSNGQTTQTATGLLPGNYTVVVTDANGCTSSQVVAVTQILGVNAAATANPPSGFVPLPVNFLNGSTGGTNYIWNFGDGSPLSNAQNPSHTYGAPGIYTVMLIVYNNNSSCADTIYLTVIVNQEISVIMPNIFTPNSDNLNDLLIPIIIGLKSADVTIYNRWGNLIANWDALAIGWDGKGKNGELVSNGTYYYVLNGIAMDDKPFEAKGWFMVTTEK